MTTKRNETTLECCGRPESECHCDEIQSGRLTLEQADGLLRKFMDSPERRSKDFLLRLIAWVYEQGYKENVNGKRNI